MVQNPPWIVSKRKLINGLRLRFKVSQKDAEEAINLAKIFGAISTRKGKVKIMNENEKYWMYVVPSISSSDSPSSTEYITKSEQEILKEFYPYWSYRMKLLGKENLISEQSCIDDWVTINWAWKVKN